MKTLVNKNNKESDIPYEHKAGQDLEGRGSEGIKANCYDETQDLGAIDE